MKLQQGTPEWLRWRKTGIGSSDAPVIMGVSPYKTPFELWLERTGRVMEAGNEYAFSLGHDYEPFIRNLVEQEGMLDDIYEPAIIVSEENPWQQASFDGVTIDNSSGLECKLNDPEKHGYALEGKVCPEHYAQVQHQLSIGLPVVYYASAPYVKNLDDLKASDIVIIPVYPDEAYIKTLIQKEAEFLECIVNDTPPEKTEDDYVDVPEKNRKQWRKLAKRWLKFNARLKSIKAVLDDIENGLVALSDGKSVSGDGVELSRSVTPGRVAYAKIPQLRGVDLDQYRGRSSVRWNVKPKAQEKGENDL